MDLETWRILLIIIWVVSIISAWGITGALCDRLEGIHHQLKMIRKKLGEGS